jgi:hypothetical protein
MWERMKNEANGDKRIIISYRHVFLKLIKEKDLIKSMSYRPHQARVE